MALDGHIIYRSCNFRKKHKPKTFTVSLIFSRKTRNTRLLKALLLAFFAVSVGCLAVWYFVFRDIPSVEQLTNRKINMTTSIYDRNGRLLYQIYKDQDRVLVPLAQIPMSMRYATIASEDASFYSNHGFSIKGILRAIGANAKSGEIVEGGSTITQQLVKNTLLTSRRTILRKIKELILSIRVEMKFPKDKILEMYLNEIPYGGTSYGVESASQMYFGKDVSQLDLAESAFLAGLTKSPTTYSPFGEHPEFSIQRQREVLRLMFENGFISKKQEEEALGEKLNLSNGVKDIKAPHFVMYVKQKLADMYGEDRVNYGGLNVITTLDYDIQKMAEEVVRRNIDKLKSFHVTNAGVIIMDPSSGEILAMVGSKDYFDTKNSGNVNTTLALRSPGSSIKIVNYAYALSHGFTPATILMDTPQTYKFAGAPPYQPVNYDGKFVGPITLRGAFAQSRNVPAVGVLASYGVEKMIEMGKEMGITSWNEKNTYGLSLTLGGGSTRLIDMARVYATVANYGNRPPLRSILKVSDYDGDSLRVDCDTGNCDAKPVLDPRVAYQIIDILRDNEARAPEFGFRSALFIDGHPEVAVKTGTSNNLRDNLTIGFNQKYLVAVWVGNNDNSPMSRIASGITGAAPIWNEIMNKLLANERPIEWKIPNGLIYQPCFGKNEWFLDGSYSKKDCDKDWLQGLRLEFVNNQNHENKENGRP